MDDKSSAHRDLMKLVHSEDPCSNLIVGKWTDVQNRLSCGNPSLLRQTTIHFQRRGRPSPQQQPQQQRGP